MSRNMGTKAEAINAMDEAVRDALLLSLVEEMDIEPRGFGGGWNGRYALCDGSWLKVVARGGRVSITRWLDSGDGDHEIGLDDHVENDSF